MKNACELPLDFSPETVFVCYDFRINAEGITLMDLWLCIIIGRLVGIVCELR